jgi:peptide/nickel transport system substrate-binding protein
MVDGAGPWGTGPYRLVEGFSIPEKRSDRVVLEANTNYWDQDRFPRMKRIIFDNTLDHSEALEHVKTAEGRVDLVTDLSPLETLRVAQSPFAQVVKTRGSFVSVFGMFNMRKTGSPWRDVRLRRAMNVAINRDDLIRYAAKGNGEIIPVLLPVHAFGYDATLVAYPFDPNQARHLLRDAGFAEGLAVTLIAPEGLEIQATVIGKMLEGVGLTVERQVLEATAYNSKVRIDLLDRPAEQQTWDIALTSQTTWANVPLFHFYHNFMLDGPWDWAVEKPELQQLYEEVLRTVDPDRQQALMQQMERHTHDQAYALFLYNPILLSAVNKAVEFVPYRGGSLILPKTSVTAQHWSVRQRAMKE